MVQNFSVDYNLMFEGVSLDFVESMFVSLLHVDTYVSRSYVSLRHFFYVFVGKLKLKQGFLHFLENE